MSYSRFGWDGSDVYIYMHVDGFLRCELCALQEREAVDDPEAFFGFYLKPVGEIIQENFYSTEEMITHLEKHIAAGHTVPEDVIPELRKDDQENFPRSIDG